MSDSNFEKTLLERAQLPVICDEILKFASSEIIKKPSYAPDSRSADEKLVFAILNGFFVRTLSVFRAILILERSKLRSEWLMLSRTLFEITIDAAYFHNQISKAGKAGPTLQRIRYAVAVEEIDLLKDSEALDDTQQEKLKEVLAKTKAPGLTREEHKSIAHHRNFSGVHMRTRSETIESGKYYKPLYARLSKYAHGMTYEDEIMEADGRSRESFRKKQISEEWIGLYSCAMLVLEMIDRMCPVTNRTFDPAKMALLDQKLEAFYRPEYD